MAITQRPVPNKAFVVITIYTDNSVVMHTSTIFEGEEVVDLVGLLMHLSEQNAIHFEKTDGSHLFMTRAMMDRSTFTLYSAD